MSHPIPGDRVAASCSSLAPASEPSPRCSRPARSRRPRHADSWRDGYHDVSFLDAVVIQKIRVGPRCKPRRPLENCAVAEFSEAPTRRFPAEWIKRAIRR
jgi:hypothetical protein